MQVQCKQRIKQMKSLLRCIVAGPKKKTPYNGGELDLTYITDRIIAMAYPASNFMQKAYRNSITDVANYLNDYHRNNFLVINVSSRPYDYSKFDNQVLEFKWPDHQAPPLTTLFQIANKAFNFLLNNQQGVIVVHCNHGKGRTGTAIITVLLYLGLFKNANEALTFYNSRRFSSNSYGVDQPCQTRYLNFVQNILYMRKIPEKLIAFSLSNISVTGLHQRHFLKIDRVRDNQTLVEKRFFSNIRQKKQSLPIIGDFFIQVFQDSWPLSKQIARINYQSFFMQPEQELTTYSFKKETIKVVFKSQEISCKLSGDGKPFSVTLEFEYYCFCHLKTQENWKCKCQSYRSIEQKCWKTMIESKQKVQQISKKDRAKFLSIPLQGLEKQLQNQEKSQQYQNIYHLGVHMSNLDRQSKIIGKIKEDQIQHVDQEYFKYEQPQLNKFEVETIKYLRNKINATQNFSTD